MDTLLLKYFTVIAKEENISRAAQQLHLTQPTLSRQMKKLEEELGVSLLKREKHSVSLTEEGQMFLKRAREIIDLQTLAEEELAGYQKQLTGQLAIGLTESLSASRIIDVVVKFHKIHPDVHFRFLLRGSERIERLFESGELDFTLVPGHVPLHRYSFIRLKEEEEWGLLVRRDSSLAGRTSLSPGELAGMRLAVIDNPKILHMFEELSGFSFNDQSGRVSTYNNQYTAALMAQTGIVNALCLRLNCHYGGLVFVPLRPVVPMRTVFIWNQKSQVSDASQAFIEFLRQEL